MKAKKKYVIVGSGGRSYSFCSELVTNDEEEGELLAFCDTTKARMDNANMGGWGIAFSSYLRKMVRRCSDPHSPPFLVPFFCNY